MTSNLDEVAVYIRRSTEEQQDEHQRDDIRNWLHRQNLEIADVAAEERRNLIRRPQSGLRRARKEGKWVGEVPAGFVRDDGYLKPNLDPDYADGESGFLDLVEALEAIEDGTATTRLRNAPRTSTDKPYPTPIKTRNGSHGTSMQTEMMIEYRKR